MRASRQAHPEALLAAVGAFPAGVVILPPAVLTQEERPFQPPFLFSACMPPQPTTWENTHARFGTQPTADKTAVFPP